MKQVKDEMEKLQEAGFIVKVKDLPEDEQKRLNSDFKHFIPTSIAFKETSASTKCRRSVKRNLRRNQEPIFCNTPIK